VWEKGGAVTRLNSLPRPTKAGTFAGARAPPDLKIRGYTPDLAVEVGVRANRSRNEKIHILSDVAKVGAR